MPDEVNASGNQLGMWKDLGDGRKQITLSVGAQQLNDVMPILEEKGVKVENNPYKLGKGSVMNRFTPYTKDSYLQYYTSNQLPYTEVFKQMPLDPHQKIEFAMELYYKEPIVGSVIDMMVDFSASGFNNDCEDLEIKQYYDTWAREINLHNLIESIFLEFYRSGNVTIYKSDKFAKITKSTVGKKSKKQLKTESYKFPAAYTILNPMNVYVMGSLMFDQEVVYLSLNDELLGLIRPDGLGGFGNDFIANIMQDLPNDIVNNMKSGNPKMIPLDPKLISRITRKKQQYERYAIPFLERVFEPCMYKQKLRTMDMSTIEGLINQLVTVTVGDKEYPAGDEDLEAIANLFQTPNKAYTIFWNHTLQVNFHKPEGLETLNQDKYKQVNDDILAGLGVSRVLLDGQGGNFSTAWISILSLIERLENAREKVTRWIESEYKRIAEENGFKTYPSVRFNRMNLREDTYISDVLLAMYDRGLIDEEDVLTETGRDFQSVVEMKKRNEKFHDLFMPPEQPFQGGNTGPNGGGRPKKPGSKNYTNNRKTNPESNSGKPPSPKKSKAMASYHDLEEEYEHELSDSFSSIQSDIKSIADQHKDTDRKHLYAILMAALLASFKQLNIIGSKYIDEAIYSELNSYDVELGRDSIKKMKSDLSSWNESYVNKLANDINDKIVSSIEKGLEPDEAVNYAFQSNQYRVRLMSQAGIVQSVRDAKIEANRALGSNMATWRAHMDDKTCAICAGLDGQQFHISEIPSRPHSGCRCDLEFE